MKIFQTVRFKKAEKSGLWVNFVTYTKPDETGPSVTLVPMLHIADPLFLQEAEDEIWCHDVVLLEAANVPQGKWFSWFYRAAAHVLGLQSQRSSAGASMEGTTDEPQPCWSEATVEKSSEMTVRIDESANGYPVSPRSIKFIKADIDRATSFKALRQISWRFWLGLPFMFIFGLCALFFNPKRDRLIDTLMDDSPPKFGFGVFDRNFRKFFNFALHARDKKLCEELAKAVSDQEKSPQSICVQFGAGHMPAVHECLVDTLGYRLSSQRWVLCMSADKRLVIEDLERFGISRERYLMRLGPHISEVGRKRLAKQRDPRCDLKETVS